MKTIPILFLFLHAILASAQSNYTKYVDPFIGTGGHGHTYPGATVPFGMVQLSPDTRIDGSWDGCGGYHFDDSLIYGFSHTHLSGTGCSDYGDILLFPVSGNFSSDKKYFSGYSHIQESASPGYYSVILRDQNVKAELTASTRTGFHQYTFDNKSDSAGLIIDLIHRDQVLNAELYQVDATHLAGYRRSSAWAKDQLIFFYIEFSLPVKIDFVKSDSIIYTGKSKDIKTFEGKIYAFVKTKLGEDKILKIKVALSSVDEDGAQNNMKEEISGFDFNSVRKSAEKKWNTELSKIEVSGGTEEQYKIFYTALYHCMVVPNIYNDVDGRYRGRDFEIHKARSDYYTVFSLWDTFRAWHPLMSLIDRKRTLDYVKTFLRQYEKGGMLPVWELSSNETECMIGYHSVSVITDAYMKGIRDYNPDEMLNAMMKSAEAKDRFGLGAYMDHGYLDVVDESESVSRTLEYAYDDWCISVFANSIGRKDVADRFMKRSHHWENLFDPETNFIRPKKNGGWLKPFDPREVNNNYTEANAWQYTFFVPQDINGLICKVGGREAFEKKLDELFTTENKTTGRDQADITGMIGQYAHGNEPSHHMAYLYNYTDHPWKTQMRISQIRNEMYHAAPDGLIGNEDCGQMSAWYVMSAMGIYQVCPGQNYFDLTTPLFSDIKIHLENGKIIHIQKENDSSENQFIQKVSINNNECSKQIQFNSLMEGCELIFRMGTEKKDEKMVYNPYEKMIEKNGEERWTNPCYSDFISSPVINFNSSVFKDYTDVSIKADSGLRVFYTLNGKNPDEHSSLYDKAIRIDSSIILKAIAINSSGNLKSYISTSHFNKMLHPDWKINIHSTYTPQYNAGGDDGIIDGIFAETDWRKGGWQGYQGQDFEAVIDFGKEITVSSLEAEFLQDTRSWILMPLKVEYEISSDGNNYKSVLTAENELADTVLTNTIINLGGNINPVYARYLKVKAKNYGKLPSWHQGAGYDAYIFIDEIIVK